MALQTNLEKYLNVKKKKEKEKKKKTETRGEKTSKGKKNIEALLKWDIRIWLTTEKRNLG